MTEAKERFLSIYKQHIQRDGANELLRWLESSDFFTAPASTRFHGAHEEGLLQHVTSFLNNAANDDDIQNGTGLAKKLGIKVTLPKWELSHSDYYFTKEKNVIAKGLNSIKYMSAKLADEMSALDRDLEAFFDKNGADHPVWRELEKEASKYLK